MADALKTILVLHGPNLNMLGKREPEIYGSATLDEINAELVEVGRQLNVHVETFQSNMEGEMVQKIQEMYRKCAGIVINPAAFTHTSIAIRDALLILKVPVMEVHLSNVYKREPFRHKSLISDIAEAKIVGLGAGGYFVALRSLVKMRRTVE